MDRKIRYFVNGWSFRLSFATRPGYDGDHEDISDGDSYELGEYENSEEALAAAEAFISTHGLDGNRIGKIEARHAACNAETHTREWHHRLHRFSGLVR